MEFEEDLFRLLFFYSMIKGQEKKKTLKHQSLKVDPKFFILSSFPLPKHASESLPKIEQVYLHRNEYRRYIHRMYGGSERIY